MLTTQPTTCKGCTASVRLRDADVERIVAEYVAAHPAAALAAVTVWRARLQVCRACADLQYGTTCRHCGCLVAVRVRLTASACPRPGTPAW
ncbi:MAG: hypothetical protein A3K19_15065 [Lentisphaerae bacterium RIFOXYB12_FULL_65_16]|nr:MAG: hypothetical protein A3K18_01645 [Lentisphaerae bacterium RIFOXYA12_64_32]OGV85954.1 MAG: hypothetical protein A3K19_15065 [Lentisphaerae bacterium RIFOXYB12_FULL_65_16]